MFKILLVDDEPIIKIGVRKLLEGTDYIMDPLTNAKKLPKPAVVPAE